jgi:probable rRNA maturation factor
LNCIKFISEYYDFQLVNKRKYRNWLIDIANSENKSISKVVYVFVSDTRIKEINKKFLGRNYNTDIITFDNKFLDIVSGEIYISIPTVKKNSITYAKGNFGIEISRILVHGLLHIIGYSDKTDLDGLLMRKKENYYLGKLCNYKLTN